MLTGENTLNIIINERTFKTNMHLLANHLHVSDRDAQTLLLEQYMLVRNKNINDEEWLKEWNNTTCGEHNHQYQLFKITYSRYDIERAYFKRVKESYFYNNDLTENIRAEENDNSPYQNELIDILQNNMDQIFFSQKKKKQYVKCYLENGSKEAEEKYGMAAQTGTLRYIYNWSQRDDIKKNINRCIERNNQLKKDNVKNAINTILYFENAEDKTLFEIDGKVAEVIDHNSEIVEDLIGQCKGIKQPVKLLRDYPHANGQDKIKFIDFLESKVDQYEKTRM